jgi:hypothetical protein
MRISITRSGGYAGITEQIVDLDTSKLDPAVARKVEEAVTKSGVYTRSAQTGSTSVGADLLKYEVKIADGGRSQQVTFTDDGGPATAPLTGLVNQLMEISQGR